MAYKITDDCVGCGSCVDACESNAIVEKDDKYEITDNCTECGNCKETCPVEAIIEE